MDTMQQLWIIAKSYLQILEKMRKRHRDRETEREGRRKCTPFSELLSKCPKKSGLQQSQDLGVLGQLSGGKQKYNHLSQPPVASHE